MTSLCDMTENPGTTEQGTSVRDNPAWAARGALQPGTLCYAHISHLKDQLH
jgi:hypothetical protein